MKRSGLGMMGGSAPAMLACSLPFGVAIEDNTEPVTVERSGSSGG